jgi:hypothetical protein
MSVPYFHFSPLVMNSTTKWVHHWFAISGEMLDLSFFSEKLLVIAHRHPPLLPPHRWQPRATMKSSGACGAPKPTSRWLPRARDATEPNCSVTPHFWPTFSEQPRTRPYFPYSLHHPLPFELLHVPSSIRECHSGDHTAARSVRCHNLSPKELLKKHSSGRYHNSIGNPPGQSLT